MGERGHWINVSLTDGRNTDVLVSFDADGTRMAVNRNYGPAALGELRKVLLMMADRLDDSKDEGSTIATSADCPATVI